MKELEERIRREGTVKPGNVLKVDAFLNHQCDVALYDAMGRAWAEHFAGRTITKILTIEASGIGMACVAARHFGDVPVVFAKKAQSINLDGDQYVSTVYSFTKQREFPVIVSKKYLGPEDHVLLIDDFLANGKALRGLIDICEHAGATVEGIGIAVEKGVPGRRRQAARGGLQRGLAGDRGVDGSTDRRHRVPLTVSQSFTRRGIDVS